MIVFFAPHTLPLFRLRYMCVLAYALHMRIWKPGHCPPFSFFETRSLVGRVSGSAVWPRDSLLSPHLPFKLNCRSFKPSQWFLGNELRFMGMKKNTVVTQLPALPKYCCIGLFYKEVVYKLGLAKSSVCFGYLHLRIFHRTSSYKYLMLL